MMCDKKVNDVSEGYDDSVVFGLVMANQDFDFVAMSNRFCLVLSSGVPP